MINSEPKICKDCRFFSVPSGLLIKDGVHRCAIDADIDIVTGVFLPIDDLPNCLDMRSENGRCGPLGQLFKD